MHGVPLRAGKKPPAPVRKFDRPAPAWYNGAVAGEGGHSMIQGILFDMDGILFDTERPAMQADMQVAREMGHDLPHEVALSLCGGTAGHTAGILQAHFGPGFDYEAYHRRVRALYNQLTDDLQLMPGVATVLPALAAAGWPMAVASSSRLARVQNNLEKTGLRGYFSALVAGDMIQNSKPAPDIFLAAAAALGLAPQQCLAVEDSANGVKSAAAAGCVTVMIPDLQPPTTELRALCAAVLDSLDALPAFLQEYTARG